MRRADAHARRAYGGVRNRRVVRPGSSLISSDAPALGNSALRHDLARRGLEMYRFHARTCSRPWRWANEPALRLGVNPLAAQPGFPHTPPQLRAKVRRQLMAKMQIFRRQLPRCVGIEDRKSASAPEAIVLFCPSSPPSAQALQPSIRPGAPFAGPAASSRSTSPAMPGQGWRSAPGRSKRPSSRRFISGGQGEWSVVTISIGPSSSAAHSASRLAAPRIGGAHLNSVAPSGISRRRTIGTERRFRR